MRRGSSPSHHSMFLLRKVRDIKVYVNASKVVVGHRDRVGSCCFVVLAVEREEEDSSKCLLCGVRKTKETTISRWAARTRFLVYVVSFSYALPYFLVRLFFGRFKKQYPHYRLCSRIFVRSFTVASSIKLGRRW